MESISKIPQAQRSLRMHANSMMGMLAIQYILGIFTNLFVQFPETDQKAVLWKFALTQISILAHMILGILILIVAFLILVKALKAGDRTWLISAGIGLSAVLVAVFAGIIFINTQADSYSFIMALGFIVALLANGWGLYAHKT